MRVLHVHAGNMFGGVETLLLTHVRERDSCPALETSFALCFSGRFSEELIAAGASVEQLGNVRLRKPFSAQRARRNLRELLRRQTFDIVVTHSSWSQAIFGSVARAARVPLVFYMHGPVTGRYWLERWARRTPPDLVLCNSKFTAATSAQLYSSVPAQIIYCPVSVPKTTFTAAELIQTRAEVNTPAAATVIIQVSRMEPWKGQVQHVEALSHLRDVPNWVCWQVGGAQTADEVRYAEQLKKQAAELGLTERVRFLGQRSDVPRLLAAADIFCQPNTAGEPFGIVFIEAFHAQLPVVATDLGGAREIVNDTCGVLVPSGESLTLANTLRRLIQEPAWRRQLGAAAPTRALALCDPSARVNQFHEALLGVR